MVVEVKSVLLGFVIWHDIRAFAKGMVSPSAFKTNECESKWTMSQGLLLLTFIIEDRRGHRRAANGRRDFRTQRRVSREAGILGTKMLDWSMNNHKLCIQCQALVLAPYRFLPYGWCDWRKWIAEFNGNDQRRDLPCCNRYEHEGKLQHLQTIAR